MRVLKTIFLGGVLLLVAFLLRGFRGAPAVVAKEESELAAPSGGSGVACPLGAPSPAQPGAAPALLAEAETPVSENGWAGELRFLKGLAASRPDLAIAEVAEIEEKHERKAAAVAVCLVLAEKAPDLAAQAAWRLELGHLADEESENAALEKLAKTWAKADFARALAWAGALPSDEESRRDRVLKGVAEAVLEERPALAGQVVAGGLSSGDSVHLAAVSEVLRRWAASDYDEALAWASRFPEGTARSFAAEFLANGESASERK